jgi:protease-4
VAAAGSDKTTEVDSNSVLHIAFKTPITERTPNNPLEALSALGFETDKSIGLNDILANIRKAKTDPNIKGIYLDESTLTCGMATMEEIRNALIDFKKSKKFVVAYSEIYTQGFYYLASVADKVYINPRGMMEFHGFHSEIMFMKGALDKLGIDMQVIKVGTYKSAVEPYILTKMSDANREQVNTYLGSLYDHFLASIANSRKLGKQQLFDIANNLSVRDPEDALKLKLVDGLKYKDEVITELKKRTQTSLKGTLSSVELADYTKVEANGKSDNDDDDAKRIAVVYAYGEINGGEGSDNTIGSEKLSKALRKVRLDDKVKAVVLRVNSPGGSALASDIIWREVSLIHKVKPIIVSMGDYAASGGYYISCAADSIYAQPNTITGSIGIFALLPNMQKLFNDKLGLTFDGVKTGKYADLGTTSRPLTAEEKDILQAQVNHGYDVFTKVVAEGRHKTQAYINSIGQGRVWTGEQALKNGLVDRLGNINDAINSAARKAGLKQYKLVNYPEQSTLFKNLGGSISAEVKASMLQKELGSSYLYYSQIKEVSQLSGIQARLPFQVDIH